MKDPSIEIRPPEPDDIEMIRALMARIGWHHRTANARRFCETVERADRSVVAVRNGEVIGFARAICDGVSNGYLSMVGVAPEHRGKGVGRALVETILGRDTTITWVVRGGRDSHGFWRKLGFSLSSIAMERLRAED